MGDKRDRSGLAWRVAVALLLSMSFTAAWCPEAPLLERLQETMLTPGLSMSPQEMSALLRRHDVRRLPGNFATIARLVDEESRRNGLPPELTLAVIWAESSLKGDAVSHRGAVGLMQLMPGTAAELASELKIPWTGEGLLQDPRANIMLGAFYLSKLIRSFDDLDRALAAYNRGPAAVPPAGSAVIGGETAAFTRRVKAMIARRDPLAPTRTFGEPHPFKTSVLLSL